jgi:hypothetical protein
MTTNSEGIGATRGAPRASAPRAGAPRWLDGTLEREELSALAQLLTDAPCGLGRLDRAEVEALVGAELLRGVPAAERGAGYLQWLQLLHTLKRWQRARPKDGEALYREAARLAFVVEQTPPAGCPAPGTRLRPVERLALCLAWTSVRFRRDNPGLEAVTYWLAPQALARWAGSPGRRPRAPVEIGSSRLC